MKKISVFFKLRLALMNAGAACAASILGCGRLDRVGALTGLALFALVAGASGLNQVQERKSDRRMRRTRGRPVACGQVSPLLGLFAALAMLAAGLTGLGLLGGRQQLAFAMGGLLLYNGIYTPLKRRTLLSLIPGALCGVTPILIGWTAAGADLGSPALHYLLFFFFIWQFPHTWLQQLSCPGDCLLAGIRALPDALPAAGSRRVVSFWVAAVAVVSLLAPLFGLIASPVFFLCLLALALAAGIGLVLFAANRRQRAVADAIRLFSLLNGYVLATMLLLVADCLWRTL